MDAVRAAALTCPTIVVGLGAFGTRVARRLTEEAATELRPVGDELDLRSSRPGADDRQNHERPTDPDLAQWAEELRLAGMELVTSEHARESSATVAAKVADRARALLDHTRLVSLRDRPEAGPTRLHVLVLAHLGEAAVRESLGDVLAAISAELLVRYEPLFRSHRKHDERALLVLPLLCMPHPGEALQRDEVGSALRALTERISGMAPNRRAVAQLYVLEDVAELSVLGDAEQEACVRNFATLLMRSVNALPDPRALLYGNQPDEPIATFVCATAELPRRALVRYAEARVALDLIAAVLDAERIPLEEARLDAIEGVELARLQTPDTTEHDVRALLERYVENPEPDPEPTYFEPSEATRAHYGPDTGDAASDRAQPPADPPVGWALERMREVEHAWRLLQRRRFDDLVARERRSIEAVRDELLVSLRQKVDRILFDPPRPEAFREADVWLEVLERDVAERLEEAVRVRDEVAPPPAPSFDRLREAHAVLLDAARAKPDIGRMLAYGSAFVALFATLGPSLLQALRRVTSPPRWLLPWLGERSLWTATAVGILTALVLLLPRYRKARLTVRDRYRDTWHTLSTTLQGARGSVLDYFASRLRLARQVARVEAHLALADSIARDRKRLALIDRAVRHAQSRFADELRRLGVHRAAHRGPPSFVGGRDDDLTELLAGGDLHRSALVEPLVGAEGARAIAHALPVDQRQTRNIDVLRTLVRDRNWAHAWRREVLFADVRGLAAACRPHAAPIAQWDPFEASKSADDAADAIAAFIRRQARCLGVALRFAHHLDPTGVSEIVRGEAIVPAEAYEPVRQRLEAHGAAGRARIPIHRGLERDRAYYLVAAADLHVDAVDGASRPPGTKADPRAMVPPLFEVEHLREDRDNVSDRDEEPSSP